MKNGVLLLLLFPILLCAQTISLTRVGVPPDKDHFVTATETFTLEIALSGVTECSAVSFELQFSDARNVRFAGSWTALDFPAANIVVVDNSNYVTGLGSVTVIAMLGIPPGSGGLDDPAVVQLDFVVPPSAIHNANIVFNFRNAEAVVSQNGGTVLRLMGIPALFNVHGYVDVWPGDANNDGIVDSRDGTAIALFYGEGGIAGRIRGFPRKPASTVWAAQPALSWDSVRVTYADCNGSGTIDINDVLVVFANFSKTHSKSSRSAVTPLSWEWQPVELIPAESQFIPIELHTNISAMGVAARISWEAVRHHYEVIGAKPGTIFPPGKGFFVKIYSDLAYCEIATGNLYPDPEVLLDGVLAYLIVKPVGENPPPFQFSIKEMTGIRRNGAMFPLTITAVPEEIGTGTIQFVPSPDMQSYRITGLQRGEQILRGSLWRITGEMLAEIAGENSRIAIPAHLSTGLYFCMIETNRRRLFAPLWIMR